MKILVFCIALGLSHAAELDRFFRIVNSVIRDPTDSMRIKRIENVEPEDCAKLCWENVRCKTVEYKEEHHKCDLSTADYQNPNHTIITSPYGWETYALYPDARELAELEVTVAEKLAEKTKVEAQHTSAVNVSDQLHSLMTEATEELADMHESLTAMAETKAEYEERKQTLEEMVARYESMLKKAEASHGQTQSNIEAKAKSIAEVQELIASLRESVKEKETLISEANQEKSHLEERLKTTRASHHEKNQVITQLNAKVQELKDNIAAVQEPEVIKARDCAELYKKYDNRQSGSYTIYPNGPTRSGVKVYCDMGNGGGWTVIQKRDTTKSCRYDFNRAWAEYKAGFGKPDSDYWIGNDIINSLTSSPVTLRVEVDSKVSTYSSFQVGSEREGYKLKQAVYSSGNAGNQLTGLREMKFGTRDHENNSGACSGSNQGGFWFKTSRYCSRRIIFWCSSYRNRCTTANLNARTPYWSSQARSTAMKIRPRGF